MQTPNLKQFYIPEEQSIYLLSHDDAQKLIDWTELCQQQLEQLGFSQIEFIGKGAFGFVFGGTTEQGKRYVFKFSRINLPRKVQDRLEEEAFMQQQVDHPLVPKVIDFQRIRKQAILVMERVKGINLEEYCLEQGKLEPRLILKIAGQLAEILMDLRNNQGNKLGTPIVHGDIKPSNIVFDPETEQIGLIDWGSSVFAQIDEHNQYITKNVMDLMSSDLQQTNARLGDVYFIGEEQINGELSSPRFDEQGVAGTLYALASGQSCRFGHQAIPPTALGLPVEFAKTLEAMLDEDPKRRNQGGDYFLRNMAYMKHIVFKDFPSSLPPVAIPVWLREYPGKMDTVVYNGRRSFLREESEENLLEAVDNVELDKYYKNFLAGMGKTERAFLASVSRLGKFPVVGGLVIRWDDDAVFIDSNLNLFNEELKDSFYSSVNNMITLARSIHRVGIFKSCLFKARDTLHFYRDSLDQPFMPAEAMSIPFEVNASPRPNDDTRWHSYFEDGDDPDEFLKLPSSVLEVITRLNKIHHTGFIIFESLPNHLKIHSYYVLMNPQREKEFQKCMDQIISLVPEIDGLGISGYMKLPYKDTRVFPLIMAMPADYYPKNPGL